MEDMKSVISRLSSEIFKIGAYEIVDINQRETLLSEMTFALSGAASEENLVEIGRLLSAQFLVTGSLRMIKNKVLLSCKLVETETGKTLDTLDGSYSSVRNLLDASPDIAKRLTDLKVDRPFMILDTEVSAAGTMPLLGMQEILSAGFGANLGLYASFAPVPMLYIGLETGYLYYLANNDATAWFMEIPLALVLKYKLAFTESFSVLPLIGGGIIAGIISSDPDGVPSGEEAEYENGFAIELPAFAGLAVNLRVSKKSDLGITWRYNLIFEEAELIHYMGLNCGLVIHL
ncbi:MAG: hypothetical protein JW874_11365 [Spirochaetales bacterium]|nr:hypothetical protein [Spirochaetales bacterium]